MDYLEEAFIRKYRPAFIEELYHFCRQTAFYLQVLHGSVQIFILNMQLKTNEWNSLFGKL